MLSHCRELGQVFAVVQFGNMPGIWSGLFDRFFDDAHRDGQGRPRLDGENRENDVRSMFEEVEKLMSEMDRLSSFPGFGPGDGHPWEIDVGQDGSDGQSHPVLLHHADQGRSPREQFLRRPESTSAVTDDRGQPAESWVPSPSFQNWRAGDKERKDECHDCANRINPEDPIAAVFGNSMQNFMNPPREEHARRRWPGFFSFSTSMHTSQTSRSSNGVVTTRTVTRGPDGRKVITETTVKDGQSRTTREEQRPDGSVIRTESSDPAGGGFGQEFLRESPPKPKPIFGQQPDSFDAWEPKPKSDSGPYGSRLWNDILSSNSRPMDDQRPWWKFW